MTSRTRKEIEAEAEFISECLAMTVQRDAIRHYHAQLAALRVEWRQARTEEEAK